MQEKLKKYSLVLCLFVFLLVIIGGGLHLSRGGAFAAALSGTPLVIFAFNRRSVRRSSQSIFTRAVLLTSARKTANRAKEKPSP